MPPESSTEENGDLREQEAETTTDENSPAGSSAADGKGEEKTTADILDAVLAEGKGGEEESPDSESGQETEEGADEAKAGEAEAEEDLPDEVTDEELQAYKPKTRKRIETLLRQRDEYRDLGTVDEIKQWQGAHERMGQLTSFVENAGLVTEEVNAGFEMMRLMKNDPVKALEALRPYVARLEEITGHALPADLQEEVQAGRITEERARELSQSRSQAQLAREQADRSTQQVEQVTQQTRRAEAARATASAVSEWERQWTASDPDHQAKQGRVMEKIELALSRRRQSGQPDPSPQEAVEIARGALDAVNAEMKKLLPRKTPIDAPTDESRKATNARPEPTSMLDVIDNVLEGAA